MSIFGSMKTAVSGMNAQANRLGTVSDNIANANTTGYKEASTSFSSLVLPSSAGSYNSGGVETSVHHAISQQGNISYTTSNTDLAIQGNGFFVVQSSSGQTFLSRSGDFSADSSGNLVNSAGFTLMGYPASSGAPSVVVNGFSGLEPVNVSQNGVTAVATTTGEMSGNLNSNAAIATGNLPASNTAPVTSDTSKSSITGYDSQGNAVTFDVYYTKTADNTWDVSVYNHADAASGDTPFPYGGDGLVGSTELDFDDTGALTSGGTFDLNFSSGSSTQTISMDFSGFSQVATDFNATGKMNGQAPNPVTSVTIGKDGTVNAVYKDSSTKALYRIPLATVASPDNLTLESGNVYSANGESGVTVTGFPQTGGFGYIQSGALEESNVDLATELTNMIEAQKSYTANSKVFQAGSDLLDVLVNLQR
ncbi:flagellar hook protein FlgE [Rhizobium leucaenae]|uniref:Flagellar hook protein FlgE n=1 Tax=Rhizobium leucaenae TaxID=29450 RepID=A0A7W6ZRC2_9HYPH|nr:flagellar hook protein FlgE [Rhizobium leucaenae]MBB4567306.1 flagellar hook protein FlgE [Rhizobium leucaenae]MBB6303054.1 flagellar hook protein FlgE [Rhizobium leucaenae]